MTPDTLIAPLPPEDGRDWDCQCARCGSSVATEDCEMCGGEGLDGHDCGEDSCCCLDDSPNVRCEFCLGRGCYRFCISDADCEPFEFCDVDLSRRCLAAGHQLASVPSVVSIACGVIPNPESYKYVHDYR